MANDSGILRDQDYLRVLLDDGSGYFKVAAQHVQSGEPVSKVPIDSVQLQEGTYLSCLSVALKYTDTMNR